MGLEAIQSVGHFFRGGLRCAETGHMHEQYSRGHRWFLAVRTKMLRLDLSFSMNAQTLAEFLEPNPHVGVEFRADAKCKVFLGELGMLELFTRSNEPNLSVLTFQAPPTQWIMGLLWSGWGCFE